MVLCNGHLRSVHVARLIALFGESLDNRPSDDPLLKDVT